MPRTPLAPNPGKMTFDEVIEDTTETSVHPPARGAVAAELQEIERQIQKVSVEDEKEEGEITDTDSEEEDANDENAIVLQATPKTARTKSMLESDCRSPLLIESDEPVFEKALAKELGNMAAKGMGVNRRPLGDKSDNTRANNDSLVI